MSRRPRSEASANAEQHNEGENTPHTVTREPVRSWCKALVARRGTDKHSADHQLGALMVAYASRGGLETTAPALC